MSAPAFRRSGFHRCAGSIALACLLAAPAALGDEQIRDVYVTRGANGELSFSDQEGPGAEHLRLVVVDPSAEAVAAAERRIEQTLRVAMALEASRLAREQARAEAQTRVRSRAAVPAEPALAQRPYVDPYFAQLVGRPVYPHVSPRHRKRRDGGDPPPAEQPAEPTLSAPLLRRGGSWESGGNWLRPGERSEEG
jgi:hypothetical protein